MPFWKKSEDPWDMEPGKAEPIAEEAEKQEGLMAAQEAYDETGDTERKTVEPCPWCGKDMEVGYLYASGESIRWLDAPPGAVLGAALAGKEIYVSDEGVVTQYKTCWYCGSCRRLAVQLKRSENGAPWSSQECAEEFRKYAEQAKKK